MLESAHVERRTFLSRIIGGIVAGISSVMAAILGVPIFGSALARREPTWLPAGRTDRLVTGLPVAVTLRHARRDGYRRAVTREVVFLVKTAGDDVRALSSTCTHLGCLVSWDPDREVFTCPCHGGVYDSEGRVIDGPPPAPLASVPLRVDDNRIFVQV